MWPPPPPSAQHPTWGAPLAAHPLLPTLYSLRHYGSNSRNPLRRFAGSLLSGFVNAPENIAAGESLIANRQFKQGFGQVGEGLLGGPAAFLPAGKAAKAGLAEKTLLKRIAQGLVSGVKVGAGYGGALGIAGGMANNENLGGILKSGAQGAAVGGITGGVLGGGTPLAVAGVKTAAKGARAVVNLDRAQNEIGAVGKNVNKPDVPQEVGLSISGKVGPFYKADTMDHATLYSLHGKRFADNATAGNEVTVYRAGKPGEKLTDGTFLTADPKMAKSYNTTTNNEGFGGTQIYKYKVPAKDLVSVDNMDFSELVYKPSVTQPTQGAKHPLVAAFDKHYTPSKNPSADEKFAADYIRNNPDQALADYNARVEAKFGTHKIVAGDEAKHIIPGFNSTKSVAYHEPGSALAKVKYDQLLADQSTKHQPVVIMSGGTGAGKTSSLLRHFKPEDHAATVDTNGNVFESAKGKIDKALASGRSVQYNHVHRDIIDAFKNGVLPRTAKEGRLVAPDAHTDTTYGANEVYQRLKEHYADNPHVTFRAFENKTGHPSRPLDKLPKIGYNKSEVTKQLLKEVENAHQEHTITAAERDAYFGRKTPSAGTGRRQNGQANDEKPGRAVLPAASQGQKTDRYGHKFSETQVPVNKLERSAEYQPRTTESGKGTEESVYKQGYNEGVVDQPVLIWKHDGRLTVLGGHSRTKGLERRAAEGLPNPDTINARVYDNLTPAQARQVSRAANQGLQYESTLDMAKSIAESLDEGKPPATQKQNLVKGYGFDDYHYLWKAVKDNGVLKDKISAGSIPQNEALAVARHGRLKNMDAETVAGVVQGLDKNGNFSRQNAINVINLLAGKISAGIARDSQTGLFGSVEKAVNSVDLLKEHQKIAADLVKRRNALKVASKEFGRNSAAFKELNAKVFEYNQKLKNVSEEIVRKHNANQAESVKTPTPNTKPAAGQPSPAIAPPSRPAAAAPSAKTAAEPPKLPAKPEQSSPALKPSNTKSQQIAANNSSTVNRTTEVASVKQRGFTESVKKSSNFTPEMRRKVASEYAVVGDKATIAKTQKFLDQPLQSAHEDVLRRLQSTDRPDKQLVNDAGTVMQILDSQGRTAEAQYIHDNLAEHLTNAGQVSQAASLLLRRSPDGLYRRAVSDLKKAKVEVTPQIDNQLKDLREGIRQTVPDTPERTAAVNKLKVFVDQNIPSTPGEKAFAIWRGGLLTGVRTVSKVAVSHVVHGSLETVKDIPASGVDKFISLISGQRGMVLTGRGRIAGIRQGVKSTPEFLRTGIDASGSNVDFHTSVHFGSSIPGRIVNAYTAGPGRLHGAIYNIAGRQAELNELYNIAITKAKNAGLKGADRQKFVEGFVAKPPTEVLDAARHAGDMAAFRQKTLLGDIATRLQNTNSPGWNMVAKVIAPFSRIPSAIGTSGIIDYSPAGAVKTIVNGIKAARSSEGWTVEAQREFSRGLGRTITGFGALVPGMVLYNKGMMTLEYPKDKKEQELWKEEGKTAWSVRVGGKWRSMGTLGPAGIVLAIGAGWAEGIKNGQSVPAAFGSGMFKGALSVQEESYLSGVNSAVTAVQQGGAKVDSLAKQYAGSIIPTFVRNWAAAADPNQRQVNTPGQNIKAGIPGLREGLPIKKGPFGDNLPAGGSGIGAFVDPFYSSAARNGNNPLIQELRRLQDNGAGTMPLPQNQKNSFDGVKTTLTKPQAQDLSAQIGQKIQDLWNKTISAQAYKNLPDDQKQKVLSNVMSDATSAVKDQYAAAHQLGRFSPGYSGNAKSLSQKQQDILDGNFNPNSYFDKQSSASANYNYKLPGGQTVNNKKMSDTYTLNDAKLTSSKQSGDFTGYVSTAQAQLKNISAQLNNPKLTPQKAQQLANRAQALQTEVAKYTAYGGFSKPAGAPAYKGIGTINGARQDYVSNITKSAAKYGVDINAALAVAASEGLGGGAGDGGTSFGPFQLHVGGALPAGKDQKWAESAAGIEYAVSQIAKVVGNKTGAAAVAAIVNGFEKPASPGNEIANALSILGGNNIALSPGSPRRSTVTASASSAARTKSSLKSTLTTALHAQKIATAAIKPPKLKAPPKSRTAFKNPKLKQQAKVASGFGHGRITVKKHLA
jgi:hypothetical protein